MANLFFKEAAVRAWRINVAGHLVYLGWAWRPAEMSYGASCAGQNFFDFPVCYFLEGLAGKNIGRIITKNVASGELVHADEFTARHDLAVRGNGKETTATAAGGDVAHQPTTGRADNSGQNIGEVGDDQFSAGLLKKLERAIQRLEKSLGENMVVRFQVHSALTCAADRIEHDHTHPQPVIKVHHFGQSVHVGLGYGGYDIQGRIINEFFDHGNNGVVITVALPVFSGAVGDLRRWSIQGQADADPVFPLETDDSIYLVKVPATKNSDGGYDVDSSEKQEFDGDDDDSGSGRGDFDNSDDFDGDGDAKEASYDPDFDN